MTTTILPIINGILIISRSISLRFSSDFETISPIVIGNIFSIFQKNYKSFVLEHLILLKKYDINNVCSGSLYRTTLYGVTRIERLNVYDSQLTVKCRDYMYF